MCMQLVEVIIVLITLNSSDYFVKYEKFITFKRFFVALRRFGFVCFDYFEKKISKS